MNPIEYLYTSVFSSSTSRTLSSRKSSSHKCLVEKNIFCYHIKKIYSKLKFSKPFSLDATQNLVQCEILFFHKSAAFPELQLVVKVFESQWRKHCGADRCWGGDYRGANATNRSRRSLVRQPIRTAAINRNTWGYVKCRQTSPGLQRGLKRKLLHIGQVTFTKINGHIAKLVLIGPSSFVDADRIDGERLGLEQLPALLVVKVLETLRFHAQLLYVCRVEFV